MSLLQKCILAPFGAATLIWVVMGFMWLLSSSGATSPLDIRQRADQSPYWYLIPFATKTTRIWKYLSWVFGFAWLAAGYYAMVHK